MLNDKIDRYIETQRAMGFKYRAQNYLLQHFARFAQQRGETIVYSRTALEWAGLAPSSHQKRNRLLTVRRFAIAMRAEDNRYEIPPADAFGHQSYMWVMRGGPPGQSSIIYHYDPGRGKRVTQRLLEGYQGYLQTDAWHAYDAVHGDRITAVACWAHARRKFKDAEKALPKGKRKTNKPLQRALGYIQRLYGVEKSVREATTEERHDARQRHSLPVLDEFKGWLDTQQINPQSRLGKAIAYTLKYWDRLTVYCTDGRIEIDNNGIENKIRPFAVGRKNWLFSTSQAGAKASANLYSLIETAKAHGLNEYDYLKWVFAKLPAVNSVEQIEALLPWR